VARGGASRVELVDGGGDRSRVLAALPYTTDSAQTIIVTTPEMARYWLRVTFVDYAG